VPVARLDVYHPHSCKGAASHGSSVIRAGRVAGKSFCKIGRELGVARNSVVDRAVELGVCVRRRRELTLPRWQSSTHAKQQPAGHLCLPDRLKQGVLYARRRVYGDAAS